MKKMINPVAKTVCSIMLILFLFAGCSKNEANFDESLPLEKNEVAAVAASSAEVVKIGDNYRASVNGTQVYLGTDYIASINAAIAGLTPNRTTKEWVTIKNSGSSGNSGGA
ncbi:MAG TPA: hypothetical protein VJ720_00190, partial [Chitinophaga sp.]|nr:hypothetical protein [Chitinophaga sp.]